MTVDFAITVLDMLCKAHGEERTAARMSGMQVYKADPALCDRLLNAMGSEQNSALQAEADQITQMLREAFALMDEAEAPNGD